MKKIISLILILAICLSFHTVYGTSAKIYSNDSITFLKAIGVVEKDKVIEPTSHITRAEFAGLVSQLVMNGNKPSGFAPIFKDVTDKIEYFDEINCLGNMGIVSGYENGYFKPNNNVTQMEAVKMLISALSWDKFMIKKEDYPYGYLNIAQEYNFFENIKFDSAANLTWETATVLYCNVLNVNVISQTLYGTIEEYVLEKKVSYLNKCFNVYEIKGIVTDNGITSLTGKSKILHDQIAIDGIAYQNMFITSQDLLGNNVTAYYKQPKDSENSSIIYIKALSKNNDILKIKASNLLEYNDGEYTFRESEENPKNDEAELQEGFNVIYNGKAPVVLSEFKEEKMKPGSGFVELIDADKIGGYETVKVYSYRTVVVSKIDYSNEIIYDKFDELPVKLDIDSYKIYDAEGNHYQFRDLHEWDVLSVCESDDKEYAEIILNRSSFEAKILGKSNDDYVLTTGKYTATESFQKRYEASLRVGEYSKFYVDYEGYLVAIDKDYNMKGGLAYLIGISKSTTGIDDTCLVKLFTEKGKIVVYPLAEKLIFDGSSKTVEKALQTGKLCPADNVNPANTIKQLVTYGINGDDEINYLDTAYTKTPEAGESADTLNLHGGYNETSKYFINKTFGGRIMLDESTKVFLIPSDGNEDSYTISDYSYFYGNNYVFNAYRLKSESPVADAIVMTVDNTGKPCNHPYTSITLVKEINMSLDNNGNMVQELIGIEKNREVTVYTESQDTLDVEPGDIIRFGINSDGVINDGNYQLLFDVSKKDDANYTPATSGSYVGTHFMTYGRVYAIKDGYIQIAVAKESELSTVAEKDLYNYNQTGFKIFVVTKKGNTYVCSQGDTTDLIDYANADTACSEVYLYTQNAVPNMMVIYK